MNRVEENKENAIEIVKNALNGNTSDVGIIAALLLDISQSLAIIADCMNECKKNEE